MPRLPRYGRIAKTAVDQHFRQHADTAYIMLFTLSVVADSAAIEAGRKSELYESLPEYEQLLPKGSASRWVENGSGDLLIATNPHYRGDPPPELKTEHRPIPGPFDVASDAHVFPG